jgi:lipopolysaccharide export system protein LptA
MKFRFFMMWLPILTIRRSFAICVSLIAGFWAIEGLALEPASPSIVITAEQMTVRSLEHRAVFEGKVHVQRGDFQMEADRMNVTFSPVTQGIILRRPSRINSQQPRSSSPESRAISTIEASGHVQIITGDRHATSQTAVYDGAEEKVVLTGNPESWEKDYKVSGTRMTIFLKENRSLIEGSSVLIQP